jgi:hypothetical protein
MMNATKKKGRRSGPFQLGRRCKHAAAELGHIHEARNVQTGAPAMVMMPGPRPTWGPRKNWQVRASFQATPPFIALEVERAPDSGRLTELADLLTLLLGGLEAMRSNPRMRAHLTREPMGGRRGLLPLKRLAVAGLAVLALGGGFWLGTATLPSESSAPARSTPGGGLEDTGLPSSFLIDGRLQDSAGITYPLPDKPFSNQAKPPCITRRGEVEINGGCWVALKQRPPCHEEQAEYKGDCYLPVSSNRGSRLPQSVSP